MEFFNGLGKKFSSAARTVTEFTRDSVENTRISADLRSARAELDSRLTELGRAYYESVTGDGSPVPEALIAGVREAMALIEALMIQQARNRRQERCPGCGSVHSADAKYCSACGRPMPEPAPDPESASDIDAEYCAECGAMRQGRSGYCAVCGHPFDAQKLPAIPQEQPRPVLEPLEEPEDDVYSE